MQDAESTPLSSEEIARLDAQYQPFPSFQEWLSPPPVDPSLHRAKDEFSKVSANVSNDTLGKARDVASRAAAFDTGAIEGLYRTDRGLTLTVATQAAAWENAVTKSSGTNALDLFKAQLAAFEFVLDSVTERMPVTHVWLRRLHEVLTEPQETYVVHTPAGTQEQPLPRGEYKKYPNHVRVCDDQFHSYAPVEETHSEMTRLIEELASPDFCDADPILQASYAHYAFVVVHPFADGNGRVARAIASTYTYRDTSVPLLVLADHRDEYLRALADADSGEIMPFVRLVSKFVREALEIITESLKTAAVSPPEELLKQFEGLQVAQANVKHEELDELANQVAERLTGVLEDRRSRLVMPEDVGIRVSEGSAAPQSQIPNGYRSIVKPGGKYVDVSFSASRGLKADRRFKIFVSKGADPDESVYVLVAGKPRDGVILGLEDISPDLSLAAEQRLVTLSDRVISSGLRELLDNAKEALRESGYS